MGNWLPFNFKTAFTDEGTPAPNIYINLRYLSGNFDPFFRKP